MISHDRRRLIAALLRSEDEAKRVLKALDAGGYACVPRVPTEAMLEAGWYPAHMEDAGETWRAMMEVIDDHK
jgi:hypothetical protein